MTQEASYHHAVCLDANRQIAHAPDPGRFDHEIFHLGMDRSRSGRAEAASAIVGVPLHCNLGALLADVRGEA